MVGTHSQLLKDPKGVYSQLIRLQEMNRDSKRRHGADEKQSRKRMPVMCPSLSQPPVISHSHSGSGGSLLGLKTIINNEFHETADPKDSIGQLETSEKPPTILTQLGRLAYLNKPEIPMLIVGSISAIINGVMYPVFGILVSSVVKTFYEPPQELKKQSKFWALNFVAIGVLSLLAYPTRTYFFAVAGGRLIRRIRLMCFEKVVNMEVGWFDEAEHSSGVIGAKLSVDATTLRALVGDALAQMVQNVASGIVGLTIAFETSWQLALIILTLIPLVGANGYVQMKFLEGFSADAKVCLLNKFVLLKEKQPKIDDMPKKKKIN
ncbi:unnamed protein product [Ilex paraguariensis]|uniref:ABC transmembrane type-1 domain-containing protein n=1 Tax=Ilex paraguariensis TaxID=185542 RepID=A0ABC8RQH3_9AQUA